MQAIVLLVSAFGIALSVKSIVVLRSNAPWTSAGWWFTIGYFIAVVLRATLVTTVPEYLEYAILAALSIVFIVAGMRDERQAEPWWWPNHRGITRAEKRRPV